MTSTLQQEAGRKLRLSSQQTMRTAQRLYENGYITYMRTDSTTLSETALNAARAQARALYGDSYVPDVPRRYEKKVKNAQEAHEAIRPAGDSWRTPGELARELSGEELRLYELIWQRTVASQMTDARGQSLTVRIGGTSSTRGEGRIFDHRAHHHVPRLHAGLRRGCRRPGCRARRPRAPAAETGRGAVADCGPPGPDRALDQPAGPLHRGVADQDARGDGRRPAVDVHLDHRHHPGPRLRVQEGHRPGPVLRRVLRDRTARAALRQPGRLQLHRLHGGRPRRHRQRRAREHPVADPVLLRCTRTTQPSRLWSAMSAPRV